MIQDVIHYKRFDMILSRIEMCRVLSQRTGEAHCLALEGCTGAGKTTLIKTFAYRFENVETEFEIKRPVFYMETPCPITVKTMAARMLEGLGDVFPEKGSQANMNSRLVNYLKRCQVEVVILDDIQHLTERRGGPAEYVTDWLKVLIKESNIPFIIVGQEGQVENILKKNSQLSRLFAARESLSPFSIKQSEGRNDFAAFFKLALDSTGMEIEETSHRNELIKRIHYSTSGVPANTINLIQSAVYLAESQNQSHLTLAILSDAFELRLKKHTGLDQNPFNLELSKPFTPPPTKLSASRT